MLELNMIADAYHEAEGYTEYGDTKKVTKSMETLGVTFLKTYLAGPYTQDKNGPINEKLTKTLDNDDNTMIHWIFKRVFCKPPYQKNSEEMFEYMVTKYPTAINARPNFQGKFPIHLAVNHLRLAPLQILVQNKISLKRINEKNGENLWHMIAKEPFLQDKKDVDQIFDLLLRAGVSLRMRDLTGISGRVAIMKSSDTNKKIAMQNAMAKETMRAVVWIIYLQEKGKLKTDAAYNLGMLPHQCQHGILQYIVGFKPYVEQPLQTAL
jgi:succinate dehydrogenase flavin-adding protein (antitoxin of CptAB toxin-antitoxin module)